MVVVLRRWRGELKGPAIGVVSLGRTSVAPCGGRVDKALHVHSEGIAVDVQVSANGLLAFVGGALPDTVLCGSRSWKDVFVL